MKNFYLKMTGFLLLGNLLLGVSIGKASSLTDEQKEVEAKSKLHIQLSLLQELWPNNQYSKVDASKRVQYVNLQEGRIHKGYKYFFAVQVIQPYLEEHYEPYYKILGAPEYSDRILTPTIFRVFGRKKEKDGQEDSTQDFYRATYEIVGDKKIPVLRFHVLLISELNEKNLPPGFALPVLIECSKQDSLNLGPLFKRQEIISEKGMTLEELTGKKTPGSRAFKRKHPKKSVGTASSSQPINPEPLARVEPENSSSFASNSDGLALSSSTQEGPFFYKTKKGHFTGLDEIGVEVLQEFQASLNSSTVQAESSSSASIKPVVLTEEIPTSSTSVRDTVGAQITKGRTSSPSLNRGRNNASVNESAAQLLAGKKK